MTDFKIDTTQYNQVDYFGLILSVPKQYEYIAMDNSGSVYAFIEQPQYREYFWGGSACVGINFIKGYKGDWKQSLKKVSDILINKTVTLNEV